VSGVSQKWVADISGDVFQQEIFMPSHVPIEAFCRLFIPPFKENASMGISFQFLLFS
jgi:hypothetical protein